MSISQLHALQSLSVIFLVPEVPKSEICDLGSTGGRPPILLQPRVLTVQRISEIGDPQMSNSAKFK